MLTKAKALYQVKLILDYLPKEEYELIPKETIEYIEDNFEYDEKITINPRIPLEKQKIDSKAYDMLEKIIKQTEKNKVVNEKQINEYVEEVKESNRKFNEKILKNIESNKKEINEYISKTKRENEILNTQIENIKLKNIIETLEKENSKIPKAKELVEEYKEILKQKEIEIEKLKENNKFLYECNQKIPKFIRKIFIKEDIKLLKSKGE